MRISVNGEERSVADPSTVDDLAVEVAGERKGTAVAVNGEVVPRSEWAATWVREGDRVEVLTARQGG